MVNLIMLTIGEARIACYYWLMDLLHQLKDAIDPKLLLTQFGYIGLFLIVFAESGLLVGFFLPGDSLLFTAGILAATGIFNIWVLFPLIFFAAVIGDQVGYMTGATVGRKLFNRENSMFFKKHHVEKSQRFFEKHGASAIIIARFVPIVRTFTPILAGVGKMPYKTFVTYNIIGGLIWGIGMTALGYWVGGIPGVEKYVHYIALVIIVLSLIPAIKHLREAQKA